MGAQTLPQYGQSNFDLTLEIYGNMDYFMKLLQDNSIVVSSSTLQSKYISDSTLKNINSNLTGITYATKNFLQNPIQPPNGSFNDFGGGFN